MQITINAYESEDKEQLKHLFQVNFEDENLLTIVYGDRKLFAYSALLNHKLVGILFAWKNTIHPNCIYFRILVNPLYHSLPIAELLLEKLETLTLVNLPLQTSLWETSDSLLRIYRENGFSIIRKTYTPTLTLTKDIDLTECKQINYKKINLEEASANNLLMKKLTSLVRRNYEQSHLVNPVARLDYEQWQEFILADDVLKKHSYMFLDHGEILAYSFLHKSDLKGNLELGWCGANNVEHSYLIPQLVIHQAMDAIKLGYQTFSGEFDTTDKYASETLNHFPFAPAPTLVTLQKK